MTTLQSLGKSRPAGTRARLIAKRVYRGALAGGLALVIAALAHAQAPAPRITPFSSGTAFGPPPAPWQTVKINERKRLTQYEIVPDGSHLVLHAHADAAASALGHPLRADVAATPWLRWSWRVQGPIADADPAVASREDSPARVVLEFDGDRASLPLVDRAVDEVSVRLSGRHLPYATLMYVMENQLPIGTIVPNPHTRRVQMIVAGDATAGTGWRQVSRNVLEDFRRAFGEEPQALLSVGVLTDADNTGGHAEAWYGDITLESR